MAIEHMVDHRRKLVVVDGNATVTGEEMFAYQREVWSDPRLAGYDELVDMSRVERLGPFSSERARELARMSAAMDPPDTATKMAIVAPDDLLFGLGRMYEAFREAAPSSRKQVAVFRTRPEAMAWLGHAQQVMDKGSA
jgi:hypothetical protein